MSSSRSSADLWFFLVVTAGNEDEFVDIEGEGLMSYDHQQTYDGAEYGQQESFETFDQNIYSGSYGDEQSYGDFQSELFNDTYVTDACGLQTGNGNADSSENIDLGLLLLQDLVHSDEDDDESDEDIPLDDGDEDIPLDDGKFFVIISVT